MKLLLFLLALSIAFHFCSCHFNETSNQLTQRRPPQPRRPPPPGSPPPLRRGLSLPEPGFDYFTLSLTWPNAYCRVQGVTCRPSYPKQYFTIHGLWPQKNNNIRPDTCRQLSTLTDQILTNNEQRLQQFWPHLARAYSFNMSKNFWHVQWSKHGSCSSNEFTAAAYFDRALQLGSTYSSIVLQKLQAKQTRPDGTTLEIKPDGRLYSWEDILRALKRVTGKDAAIACDLDASRRNVLQLLDVFLCFESNGTTPKDCSPNLIEDKCKTNLAFSFFPPSPPPPRSLGTPPFNVSPTLEIEEIATH